MSDPAIKIHKLAKSYTPGVPVLVDFDFDLRRGEVHALVGSNGAGKSTMARILTGLTPRDEGDVHLHGTTFTPTSKHDATRAGVVMVLQELNIIPSLSVAENLFIHQLPNRLGILKHARLVRDAHRALRRVGLERLDPDMPAGRLGVGQQQLVEIAAALTQESSVLILDEPTAALTGPEIDLLFKNIHRLRANGVAIVYISHRMDDISQIADRVTVMRDGRRVATHATGTVDTPQLVREMAGSEIAARTAPSHVRGAGEIGLTVQDIRVGDTVRGVSFTARKGEILGLAGLIGSGRTETLRAIFGADPMDSGQVMLGPEGRRCPIASPAEAVRAGIALIPEDRKQDGLLLGKAITTNVTLATTERQARLGVLSLEAEERVARKSCDRLAVKLDRLDQMIDELSGGNQQKVVVARWLLRDCGILLFDEPTRGIDVASKETIYELLDELAAEGKTLVIVSSDLGELMRISHRILAMSNGRITGEFLPENWTQERITSAAFIGYAASEKSP